LPVVQACSVSGDNFSQFLVAQTKPSTPKPTTCPTMNNVGPHLCSHRTTQDFIIITEF